MNHSIKKIFWSWNFDQEEQWLNEMSEKGYCFLGKQKGVFLFEDGIPGEFRIQMRYLGEREDSEEGKAYIREIVETGGNVICIQNNMIYFSKKKTADAHLEQPDIDSKIRQVERMIYVPIMLTLLLFLLNYYGLPKALQNGYIPTIIGYFFSSVVGIFAAYVCLRLMMKRHAYMKAKKGRAKK